MPDGFYLIGGYDGEVHICCDDCRWSEELGTPSLADVSAAASRHTEHLPPLPSQRPFATVEEMWSALAQDMVKAFDTIILPTDEGIPGDPKYRT
jgi:hypothetical protein